MATSQEVPEVKQSVQSSLEENRHEFWISERWKDAVRANPAACSILDLPVLTNAEIILRHENIADSDGAELIKFWANSLINRFYITHSQPDLDLAIELLEKIIRGVPEHRYCLVWKSRLAAALSQRAFSSVIWSDSVSARNVALETIKKAFVIMVQTILEVLEHRESYLKDNNIRVFFPDMLEDLGRALEWLRIRFNHGQTTGHIRDYIDEDGLYPIIQARRSNFPDTDTFFRQCNTRLRRMAVDYTSPDDNPLYLKRLIGYAPSTSRDDNFSNLQVVRELKTALHQTPEQSHLWADLSATIAYSLDWKLEEKHNAIAYYLDALNCISYDLESRIAVGFRLSKISFLYPEVSDRKLACEVSIKVIELIPEAVARTLGNTDKRRYLRYLNQQGISALLSNAVFGTIRVMGPARALQLLEKARGQMAGSIQELRPDVIELPGILDRETAKEFAELQETLSSSSVQTSERFKTRAKFEGICGKIRELPGYQDFPHGLSDHDILAAAQHGPIVVINVPEEPDGVCDAILISYEHKIKHLELRKLWPEDIWARQPGLQDPECLPSILSWLWVAVAKPVLDELGFHEPQHDNSDNWPRIWWIPTGPLGQFPIHAAGCYDTCSTDTVLDRVMSSYSSSIKALILSRRSQRESPIGGDEPHGESLHKHQHRRQALLVSMAETPGASDLVNAETETSMVRSLCDGLQLQASPEGLEANKSTILSYLQEHSCQVFHFAGHGLADADDPSQSALLLKDCPLTVDSLLEINMQAHAPFLAYLSACGTGQAKDQWLNSEALHLISAFQLAGVRHVIGTLWEVNDASCVEMARVTYEWIRDHGMTDAAICRGLHQATRRLRGQWMSDNSLRSVSRNGEGDNGIRDARHGTMIEDDLSVMHWVPYVHYGA